ncbi:MAG: hypothetical protein KDC80_01615 [Saprospiraceae bacterium]|nr:hypothetical protein [Saprospiraceae bacterium]
MIKLITILLFLIGTLHAFGQKAILLERQGSLRTDKFFVGETLVFKLKNDRKHWLEEVILDLDLEEGYVLFEHRTIPLKDIIAIQIRDAGKGTRAISTLLTTFSYSWGFWTLVSLAFGDSLTPVGVGIGLGSFLVGKLLRVTFFKTHRLKKRKRLRMVDLTFYEILPART